MINGCFQQRPTDNEKGGRNQRGVGECTQEAQLGPLPSISSFAKGWETASQAWVQPLLSQHGVGR